MNSTKAAETARPIEPLLANRWSTRAFDPERPVQHDTLVSLFEAARWAPSCFNQQPWRFIVCDRFEDPECWNRALQCLVEGNRRWAERAPILIAALSDQLSPLNTGDDNRWANYDTGAASENICLQATAMGLAIHQMGGFEPESIRTSLEVPAGFDPIAIIALGYPGDPGLLKDWQRGRETGPRTRRPLGEIVFAGSLEKPFLDAG